MKDRTATDRLSIVLVMRSEAEKIAQRMMSPSSEALTRILYAELIDRVIKRIEETDTEEGN
jgi:predicted solute-binding protein